MVSTRDLENVVAQVNVKFEELFKKIVQLEKQLADNTGEEKNASKNCLLYTSPSPRDGLLSRMPSSA